MNGDQLEDSGAALRVLGRLRDRFEQWRQQKGSESRRRIPSKLWEEASNVARELGVTKVAQTLRLDYASLKRRIEVDSHHLNKPTSDPFFELVMPDCPSGAANEVELVNRQGDRMTFRLHSTASHIMVDLTKVFLQVGI